jgi:exosortase
MNLAQTSSTAANSGSERRAGGKPAPVGKRRFDFFSQIQFTDAENNGSYSRTPSTGPWFKGSAMSASIERPRSFVLPGVLLALLLLVFTPSVMTLWDRWLHDSRYNHGYLVPLFSLYLLYRKKDALLACPVGSAWGLALILIGLAIRAVGVLIYLDWLDTIALLPCLAGLLVLWGGRPALALSWPALAFLVFMIPLPFRIETALSLPLQRLATAASTRGLRVLGYPAFAEGNIIRMGDAPPVNVAEACSGLSMLMIFFALCTAVAMLMRRPLWERLLVVLAAVPIALVSNFLRIVLTAVLYYHFGQRLGDWMHDYAGWVMMPVALLLLLVLSLLFNWMFPLRREEEDDPVFAGVLDGPSEQFQPM